MKNPLVRLFLVIAIYSLVLKMGYGLITGFFVTMVAVIALNFGLKILGFFLGRRTA